MAPNNITLPYELTPMEIAEQLILNGYSPCPLEPRSKAIKVKGWQNIQFNPTQFGIESGIGVKTGRGLVALDIDVYDREIAEKITQSAFEAFGSTLARVGEAPKLALLYRSEFFSVKQTLKISPTDWVPEQKPEALEVLSKGQQLVVAAIHPSTHQSYRWDGITPWSPVDGHIDKLPLIDEENWQKFRAKISSFLVNETTTHKTQPSLSQLNQTQSQNHIPSLDEVCEILSYIPSNLNYDGWLQVTMGLKSLGEQYRSVWEDWSATGQNHDARRDLFKWNQVTPTGGINFGTVCHYAQKNGADLSTIARKYLEQVSLKPGTFAEGGDLQRNFEELLETIQTLSENDFEDIEAVIDESKSLPSIKRETIDKRLKDATGYTLTAIRKQRSELFEANPEPDQLDLAKKAISEISRDNVLHTKSQTWLWNQAGVWSICEDRKIKQITQQVINNEGLNVYAALVNGVCDVLKSEINSADHLFNLGNPETVNCLNGQLELEDGIWQLKLHKREEYRTTQIPIEYNRDATAGRFQTFLNEIFVDDTDANEKIECLLQMIGYTLMSHSRHEKFIMLIGNGANGKSVLLAIIEALCGSSNVAGVQPSKFESSFQRAHLHNKLANIVTELSEGEKLADAELKSITSGEPVTVEHKYQHPFNLRPYSTCWFGTNHMPPTSDFSDALFRRAVIVTFNRTFQSNEQNPNLKDDLENELSGILNLSLAAYAEALKNGFTIPASSQQARDEWKLETNQVAQFVVDECDARPEATENFSELYRCYQGWVDRNHLTKPLPAKTFSLRIQRLGFNNGKSGPTRKFKGLQLKKSFEA